MGGDTAACADKIVMLAYFAYGANMSRSGMAARCPTARAAGVAALDGWAFTISRDGYGSVVSVPSSTVYGVLWWLSPRDVAVLDAYEGLSSGLYRRRILPVRHGVRRQRALLYIGRPASGCRPKPGYLEGVIAAALDWDLPGSYVSSLQRLLASGFRAAAAADVGELS